MEIRVEETLTGRNLRERILARYRSRQALEEAATGKGAQEAREDLAQLRLLDADPRRLTDIVQTTTVSTLSPEELARLTPQRIKILQYLANRKSVTNLTGLVSGLKRDKKHVSEDLRMLEKLGLLTIRTEGRNLRPELLGNEIRIIVTEAK